MIKSFLVSCGLAAAVIASALMPSVARAASDGIAWDPFPTEKLTDQAALQNGAKLFVNHCLNCHGAAFVRYNRLQELGLSDEQIKSKLIFNKDTKVGDTMKTALDAKSGKEWFGAAPPDLTLVARSRADITKGSGPDYLYTYLRSYYRDPSKATGWDNLAFPSVAMPNVLWEMQGERRPVFNTIADPHSTEKDPAKQKKVQVFKGWDIVKAGTLSAREYDSQVGDLVAFMTWMSEPVQKQRVRWGIWALMALGLLVVVAWRLNAAFWKDIK